MRRCCAPATLIALFALATVPALADNWPQWRGPHFNGTSDETGLLEKPTP